MEETLRLILDKLNGVDDDIKDLKKHVLIIENEHGKKLDTLFDRYIQVYEKASSLDKKVDKLSLQVESLNVEIGAIKNAN